MSDDKNPGFGIGFGLSAGFGLTAVVLICAALAGCPSYNVYSSRLSGEAEYARAEQNRRVKTLEAEAKKASAQFEADAEVIRAQGVASANKILAESLGGPEGYLRWKYIQMLEDTGSKGRDVIYVPTEGALPILEAGKRPKLPGDH